MEGYLAKYKDYILVNGGIFMNLYLHVGTDEIRSDLFQPISDINSHSEVKPSGGLWLTKFNPNTPSFNHWVDYLIDHPYILFYKNEASNPFRQPCSVICLSKDAKKFNLKSKEGYQFLINNYSDNNGSFSFEKLSNDYDGINMEIWKFIRDCKDMDIAKKYLKYDVDSLILFNTDVIEYYCPGVVDIEPFDYEFCSKEEVINYQVLLDDTRKCVVGSNSRKR